MQFTGDFVKIHTDSGDLRGKRVKNVKNEYYYSFQGIPYAKPPIGELRFKAPEPVEPWQGVKDALYEGPVAPSFSMITRRYIESSNEDCLFLNIYTSNLTDSKPVMFYIHGGSFNIGSGNTDLYGPDYLVRKDIVLVTCNYRLGPLGFLSLETKKYPGNNGLKDIVMALKWVRQNVKYFGGDDGNVTIFGESAGGAAVEFLMLSKTTKNLFHKAISQSGSALSPWALSRSPREYSFFLGELLGCKTQDDDELISFLKSIPPEDLITNGRKVLRTLQPDEKYERSAFIPCVEPDSENAIITRTPKELYESGDYQYVPFMTGLTNGEGIVYLDDGVPDLEHDEDLRRFVPNSTTLEKSKEIIRKIKERYFPNGVDVAPYIQILSSIYFLNGINFVVESMQKNTNRVQPLYYYFFTFDGAGGFYKILMNLKQYSGACHCDELGYLFKVNLLDYVPEKESKEDKMVETMTKLWTNFAKFNDPTPKSEIAEWKPVDPNNKYYLDIGDSLVLKTDLCPSEIQFWKDIFRFISNRED